jgi:hypothetical protein
MDNNMTKLGKLIDKIGIDKIQDYLFNRTTNPEKEIKKFILNEIKCCKPDFHKDGFILRKDGYKLFNCVFKTKEFWYDHQKIYIFLIFKYKTNEIEINNIIKDILVENLKYNDLTPRKTKRKLLAIKP